MIKLKKEIKKGEEQMEKEIENFIEYIHIANPGFIYNRDYLKRQIEDFKDFKNEIKKSEACFKRLESKLATHINLCDYKINFENWTITNFKQEKGTENVVFIQNSIKKHLSISVVKFENDKKYERFYLIENTEENFEDILKFLNR